MRRLLLCAAAVVPFVPAAAWFARNGIPDVLFTGDGAALELGTRHAMHAAQLVGPYSRFGWNHPGPAFFYLALPFYALFGQRGPALNVFALCVNLACALLIVLSARRLRGDVFALAAAALLATYELVAKPAHQVRDPGDTDSLLDLAGLSGRGAAARKPSRVDLVFSHTRRQPTHLGGTCRNRHRATGHCAVGSRRNAASPRATVTVSAHGEHHRGDRGGCAGPPVRSCKVARRRRAEEAGGDGVRPKHRGSRRGLFNQGLHLSASRRVGVCPGSASARRDRSRARRRRQCAIR